MILDREQFKQYWNNLQPGLASEGSPLWAYEDYDGKKCQWFVSVDPSKKRAVDDFWDWCHKECQGSVACYSSSPNQEWWGFTDRDDIVWWLLRWA